MNTHAAELSDRRRSRQARREQQPCGRQRRLYLECLEDRRVLSMQPFPVPLLAVEPLGSLIYEGSVEAEITAGGETDSFTIDLDDGQTVTVVVVPEETLQPTIELLDPGDAVIGTAASVSPGQEAMLQAGPTTGPGQYTIRVAAASETTGRHTTRLILNAAVEAEEHGGPLNDQMASAEDLAASFAALPGGSAERGAVLGNVGAEPGEPAWVEELIVNGGFETGDFSGWTALSSSDAGNGPGELTPWTVGPAGGGFFYNSSPYAGTFSAYNGFDGEARLQYELYQAVTVPDPVEAATLTTHHRIVYTGGALDPQDRTLQISIRDTLGGQLETLYAELLTPASGPQTDLGWRELSFDVGRYAGRTVQIHFLELVPETHTGPALIEFDEISLAVTQPAVDWYRFALHDGQSATLALDVPAADSLMLDLYDAAGTRLATGVPADNVVLALGNFVDGTADGSLDSYYVRVAGRSAVDYRLVVTRNADFETDADYGPTESQSIMPSGVVLGHSRLTSDNPRQKLTASDAAERDMFGWSVSIDGDAAIVGTPYDDGDAGWDFGSAYVFRYDRGPWIEQQKLTGDDTGRFFGLSVAIDGNTAIVGALDPAHTHESGAAYIFRFQSNRWVEQQKLTTSDDRGLGYSVAIDGDTAVVGAISTGAVHFFRFIEVQWVLQQSVVHGNAFGNSVAIDGNTAIVGQRFEDSAYVYRFDGSQWVEEQILTGSDDFFGCSVAIDGDAAIVGAYSNNDAGPEAGAAYLFHFNGDGWIQQQKLIGSDTASGDRFGNSVSISDGTAVVGAYYDRDAGMNSGSAYVFRLDGARWVELQKLTAVDAASGDEFGGQVSISGNRAILGAHRDFGAGHMSGSAYIASLSLDLAEDYSINVQAGDTLAVTTATPAGGPGELVNELDPAIGLYDPSGALAAHDDNGAGDGRNAALTHDAALTGTYTVRMVPAGDAHGEFLLSVAGQQGAPPAFEVRRIDPPDGARRLSVTQITVDFNDVVLLSSLQAADLSVDGVPAAEVHLLDGNTAVFILQQVPGDGLNYVAVAAGAVVDVQGTPIEPLASTLMIDATPPRVIASSVEEGGTVPVGPFTYTVQFDELLNADGLEESDVELVSGSGSTYVPTALNYDPVDSILTLQFAALEENPYTLTLRSGHRQFEDAIGNSLDGGPSFPLPSGDGLSGGDFVLHFVVHDSEPVDPLPFQAVSPRGSLIYGAYRHGTIASADHPDMIPFYLDGIQTDGGRTVTVAVDPGSHLWPTVELLDPGGVTISTATASATGRDAVLQVLPANGPGLYTVVIGAAANTFGEYRAEVTLNAAVESEGHWGPPNDDSASAQELDDSFIRLTDGTAQRGAVLGAADGSEDWYVFTLGDGQSATLALSGSHRDDVSLQLYDRNLNLLAEGTPAENVTRVINDFVDSTSDGDADPYFVYVPDIPYWRYRLLITRDVAFDTEFNRPSRPQEIATGGLVLGHVTPYRQYEQSASDVDESDCFGYSVAIDGNTAIVGAYRDKDARYNAGSAYVYHFDGIQWVERQKLTASDAGAWDSFGRSVAIDGNTAIVGASGGGDAVDASGAAYVFRFDGSQWIELQKLTASDAAASDYFGRSVAIDGHTAIVGASGNDDAGYHSGSAYMFHFDGIRWSEQQKLTASDAVGGDYFGLSVAIDADTAIVGASANERAGDASGSAYVFHFDGGQWSEQQKLTASDGAVADYFGLSVAIDADAAIVGASGNDDAGDASGSAYVFHFDGIAWVEQQKLTASQAAGGDYFGCSVAIDGDTAVVGAFRDDDPSDDSGSAYLFRCDNGRWSQQHKLTVSGAASEDYFGFSVSTDGDWTILGTYSNQPIGGDSGSVSDEPLADNVGSVCFFTLDSDNFSVSVEAGQTLVVETATPGNGPGQFVNQLDPAVELYDPAGTLVASDDNGAADGRNARIAYLAPVDGTYTVRVLPSAGRSSGEYVLSLVQQSHAVVAGRHVFYNNSAFDGNHPAANPGDDQAVAVDKRALLPGQTATFANYTSYTRGINGIMVDVAGLAGTPTVDDFALKVGNDDDPTGWADAPAPSSITVRPGQGIGGSDRLTIIWPDNAIQKQWLQVTVLAGGDSGLAEADVFYFGNAFGETGNSTTDAKVSAVDMLGARDNQRNLLDPAPIDFNFDFDRNARVGALDMLIARDNQTHFLNALGLITVPNGKASEPDSGRSESTTGSGKVAWLFEFEPSTPHRRSKPARPAWPWMPWS